MKKILQHTILAGLFLALTTGFTVISFADEEGTPPPSDSTPIQQDPAEQQEPAEPVGDEPSDTPTDLESSPVEVVPFQPLFEPETEEPVTEPTEQTPEYEVIPVEDTEPITEPTTETTEEETVQLNEEPTATTDPTPIPAVADPRAIAAKVVVVDRTASTMTLEVDGKLQLVKITPQVRILKKGKLVPLDEITSGQSIVLLARTLENGTFEVVSVAIGPAKGKAEAAGQGKALGIGWGQRVKDNPPFFNFPNPANSLGPITSPNN